MVYFYWDKYKYYTQKMLFHGGWGGGKTRYNSPKSQKTKFHVVNLNLWVRYRNAIMNAFTETINTVKPWLMTTVLIPHWKSSVANLSWQNIYTYSFLNFFISWKRTRVHMNQRMNECLTTPQYKIKSAIGCQANCIYIKNLSLNSWIK